MNTQSKTYRGLMIFFGIYYLVCGVIGLFDLLPTPPMRPDAVAFFDALHWPVYLMPLVKIIEIIAGVLLILNRYIRLALVMIMPLAINIFLFHAEYTFPDPGGVFIGIIPFFFLIALAWPHRGWLFDEPEGSDLKKIDSTKVHQKVVVSQ